MKAQTLAVLAFSLGAFAQAVNQIGDGKAAFILALIDKRADVPSRPGSGSNRTGCYSDRRW